MTTYYTPSGNPVVASRGVSSNIRSEFTSIATAFASVNTDMQSLSGIAPTIANKTGVYSVVEADKTTVIRTTSGSGAITLPSCATVGAGFNFYYVNSSTVAVAINRVGSDTFQGGESQMSVPAGAAVRLLVVDATVSGKWQVFSISATGKGADSIQLGANSSASANSAIAVGGSTVSSAANSIAIGSGASASASGAIAINGGNNSAATGIGSVAIGNGAKATAGTNAVAIGPAYASGQESFAINISDSTSTYGAQGTNSTAIGFHAKTTAVDSFALGNTTAASGLGSFAIGSNAAASGSYSTAFGLQAKSSQYGKYSYASGMFAAQGDAQAGMIVLRASTTTNTSVVLTSDSAAAATTNQLIIPSNFAFAFTGTLIGRQSGTNIAAYTVTGTLINNAGTVTMPTGTLTLIGTDTIALTTSPTLAADNTNKGLTVNSGNKLTTAIHWVCTLYITEVQ